MNFRLQIILVAMLFFSCGDKTGTDETCTGGPLRYTAVSPEKEVYSFVGIPSRRLEAKLFPNLGQRKALGQTALEGVQGVAHFFLDHDLSSGYVHPYTQNFFGKLREDDFVLKFERHGKERDRGYVSYIKRKEMQADDKLGQNIGFFRQWRLSEIRYADGHLYMKSCTFAKSRLCPQAKEESGNPYAPEIPVWSDTRSGEGLHPLQPFNKLDAHNGGAAVIIWAHGTPEQIYFVDIYAPLETIINKALEIAREYSVDPAVAISDAGSFAQKFKADANNVLHFAPIDKLSPSSPNTGAGFCYIPCSNKP